MAEFIKMPTLGFDMEEGTMGSWLKQVGEHVSKGDVLAEIESDKVTQELTARTEGILLVQLVKTGDIIPVGDNLGIVGAKDEDVSAMVTETGGASSGVATTEVEADESMISATSSTPIEAATPESIGTLNSEFPDSVKATPVARRVATENGITLSQISGSGPGGRVRRSDVEAFLAKSATTEMVTTPSVASISTEVTEQPLTRMRQAIARRMSESKATVPHFYITTDIDMAAALKLRKEINESLAPEQKASVNDLIVKAAALALRDFPNINASFGGDKIILHKEINIGSAVAVEGGLLTIVQKDTDKASISKIAQDHKEMIGRAREGKVKPEDVAGSTFTVSNLGVFDVDHFIAIISPPNAAILAIGSAKQVPVVVDGELTIGMRMKATISADHRVTDGAEAAQFMQKLKAILEYPLRLLL